VAKLKLDALRFWSYVKRII